MSNSKGTKHGIPLNEAKEVLFKSVHVIEKKETIDVSLSLYRVVAEDVILNIDIPHFDVSSKDGYAINLSDRGLNLSIPFREVSEKKEKIESGECRWVETGGKIPKGADRVVPVEMTKKANNNILFTSYIQLGGNIFKKASFIKKGKIILEKGTFIDERKIGIFPLLGKKRIKVYKKPKIGVISTGKNITERNDINCVILKSLIESNGGKVTWIKRAKSRDEFVSICRGESDLDLIVSSGGTSKGREDFVSDAISELDTLFFHGVQIKPGKPLCFGEINGIPILSLSGNSTPCLVTAYIFLIPLIRKMVHLPFEIEVKRLKTGASLSIKKMGKEGTKILPIKIENRLVLFPNFPFCFSSIVGVKDAMGLAIIDEGVEKIKKGSDIKILKFKKF